MRSRRPVTNMKNSKWLISVLLANYYVGESFDMSKFYAKAKSLGVKLQAESMSDNPHGHAGLSKGVLTVSLYNKTVAPIKTGKKYLWPGNAVLPKSPEAYRVVIDSAVKNSQ